MIINVNIAGNKCKINHLYPVVESVHCEKMDKSDEQIKKLNEDALYYHLIHKGKKVIRNKYGLFWDKRKDIVKKGNEEE